MCAAVVALSECGCVSGNLCVSLGVLVRICAFDRVCVCVFVSMCMCKHQYVLGVNICVLA